MTEIIAFLTAIGGLAVAGTAAYLKLSAVLAPLSRRRRFPIAVVAFAEHDEAARDFLTTLRSRGFRNVELTRSISTVLGRRAIVLWQRGSMAPGDAVEAIDASPEGVVLVYQHGRVEGLQLSEHVLACNSLLRLAGDLATLAEVQEVT